LGACQSEKQELELARSLCDSGSITKIIAPIIHNSRAKKKQVTTLVGCLAAQRLPSDNHFVICGPKLVLVLLTRKWADAGVDPPAYAQCEFFAFCKTFAAQKHCLFFR
jgi:ferredoxin-NADP reductase